MGYRIGEHRHHAPRRTLQDTATASRIYVQNGSRFRMAIPCWYCVVDPPVEAHCHSRAWHDHVGRPSPRHPDHVCQSWDFAHSCCSFDRHKHECDHCHRYLDMDRMVPIHLGREGYTRIVVAMDDAPEGLEAEGRIDSDRDWVVRIDLDAKVPTAVREQVEIPYTVFAEGTVMGQQVRDVVSRGSVVVLPGPIS